MQIEAYPAAGGDGTVQKMHQHAGGSAANTAIALAKLGGTPALLTHTGEDVWADQVLPVLRATGVVTTYINREPGSSTGLTFLVVSADAERTMFTYRGANRNLHPDEIYPDLFAGTDFLHISSYACLTSPQVDAVLKAVQLAAKNSSRISLDVGVEPASKARGMIQQIMANLDLMVLSESDALELTQTTNLADAIHNLLSAGVKTIALKLGKAGCRLIRVDRDIHFPGFAIEAVDSTGAGDAFCAGMIHGLAQRWGLEMTGRLANAMGALATSRWGAGEQLPSLKEVITFLTDNKQFSTDPYITQLIEKLTLS